MGKVLVTGASGQVGIQIVAGLLDKDYEVIGIDYNDNPFNANKSGYNFIPLPPTEKEKFSNIFKNNLIDTVIHAACVADNDIGPVILDEQINASRVWDSFLYKMANLVAVKQFILISTTQVYKNPETREPVREDDDLEPVTNYAKLKVAAEDAIAFEFKKTKTVAVAAARCAPFYSKDLYENLSSKIIDAKDGSVFLYRAGDYGFHFCNIMNLVDFIICYIRNTEKVPANELYLHSSYFNIADKELITASQIVSFMREFHTLGPVLNRPEPLVKSSKLKLFLKKANEEQITNYRYFDSSTALGNHMYEINKAARICPFRWKISNTK
jgi:UDP-glucose 4-epimerase